MANNDFCQMGTRPGKRLHNELEKHHAMKMGKSTILTGPWLQQLCVSLPEGMIQIADEQQVATALAHVTANDDYNSSKENHPHIAYQMIFDQEEKWRF